MKIFATYSIKGGVGKTASAVNLSYLAARDGARTLVWDLDPQGASSYYFRIKPKIKGGEKTILRRKKNLDNFIKGTDYENLDLLPADFSYRNMDLTLRDAKKPTEAFTKLLQPLNEEYDYLFIDCPPSISLVSENVFKASQLLLIPLIPTTLSLRTFAQVVKFCHTHDVGTLRMLPFFSMVDLRKKMHKEVMESLHQENPNILKSYIPYASVVEKMGIHRAAVGRFAGKQKAAMAYEALWNEIQERFSQE